MMRGHLKHLTFSLSFLHITLLSNIFSRIKITTIKLVPCGTDGRLLLTGFQGVVTLILYRVIRHTVMHQSLTSIYIPTRYIHTTTVLRPFFWDQPAEPVPEENFWTLWCKGRLTEAETPTIRLGATPSGLTTAHLHHPHIVYRPDALPAAKTTVSKQMSLKLEKLLWMD